MLAFLQSCQFGSMSYFRCSIVPTSRSCGGAPPPACVSCVSSGGGGAPPVAGELLRRSLHTAKIPFSSMSRFNLDFRESKPKFLSPNSFSTIAEITPTTSLYLLWKYQRVGKPTLWYSLRFIISENIPVRSTAAQ